MYKEMIIKIQQDETAVALVEDQQLVEIYFERSSNQRLLGNIYKGTVENILPGMQAAFVNIGLEKNSFLYVDDALPKSMLENEAESNVRAVNPNHMITQAVKKKQEILVQIFKEPVGSKGARVTTHPTLPGRYIVLMPTVNYIGISRRIEDENERQRLKELAAAVLPAGMGMIVRTVAYGVSKELLAEDVKIIVKQWKRILGKFAKSSAACLIHRDSELIRRMIRDTSNDDVDGIYVDSKEGYDKLLEIAEDLAPVLKSKIALKAMPDIFELYDVKEQIDKALRRKVWLKSGGYIVVDQMEALTSVDVNTGKFVGDKNLADTVFKTNMEAAKEVAKQLRLRNIGGIIIIDFIDMEDYHNKMKVLACLEEEIKKSRTKTIILGMTQLGLVELTRKKIGHDLVNVLEKDCPFCNGTGKVLSEETMSFRVKKQIAQVCNTSDAPSIFVEVHPAVASFLIGPSGHNLKSLEEKFAKNIIVKGNIGVHMDDILVRGSYNAEEDSDVAPVHIGQKMTVKILEPHVERFYDGIARVNGFVINIADGGKYVGQTVEIEIESVLRTSARARIIEN